MRVAIIRFPGSNCEPDAFRAVARVGGSPFYVFHRSATLDDADAVILPGGFSYGDYLRAGAIARFSPVMSAVARMAEEGKPVLGICNGFQILCEAHLLPGALTRNITLQFASRPVDVRVERTDTPFTNDYQKDEIVRIPIGHGEGRFVASDETLADLESNGRVVLRYVDLGRSDVPYNPNGAANDIAAICNARGNVVGMMPHPERMSNPLLGSDAGARFFSSLLRSTPVMLAAK